MTDPVQIVHVRVRGIGRTPRPELRTIPPRVRHADATREPQSFLFRPRAMVDFAVYDRDELRDGDVVAGSGYCGGGYHDARFLLRPERQR